MNFGQWIGLVALVLALSILWQIRQLLLLLLVAVILATAMNRLVRRLLLSGMKRSLAAVLSLVSILVVLLLIAALIIPPFANQFQQLVLLVPQGLEQLETWVTQLFERLPGGIEQFVPRVNDLSNQIQPIANRFLSNVFRLFSGMITLTGGTLFIIVFTMMLLINPQPYRQGFLRLIPAFYRRRSDEILTLCETDLVNWIIGTLINMVVITITSGIVLALLGVKLVFANALLAGLLEAIPNVGPVLSTIAPAAIALLDSPIKALAVVIVYILIQQLEQFVLVPMVMGRQVSLLPAVTLLAQIVFANFFGFLGLLLAIPLVVIVRIVLREVVVYDVLDRWRRASEIEPLNAATIVTEPHPPQLSGRVESSPSEKTNPSNDIQ